MKRLKDRTLNFITLGLAIFLIVMGGIPIVAYEDACGTATRGMCFATWLGSAGSVISGIGVFVLIYDLRQRLAGEAREDQQRIEAINLMIVGAKACINAIDFSFGTISRRLIAIGDASETVKLALTQKNIKFAEQSAEQLEELAGTAQRVGVPEAQSVHDLRRAMIDFHAQVQISMWTEKEANEISGRIVDAAKRGADAIATIKRQLEENRRPA